MKFTGRFLFLGSAPTKDRHVDRLTLEDLDTAHPLIERGTEIARVGTVNSMTFAAAKDVAGLRVRDEIEVEGILVVVQGKEKRDFKTEKPNGQHFENTRLYVTTIRVLTPPAKAA